MYNTCNKVLIASIVALFLLIGFSICSFAQSKLVADETEIKVLKGSIKVETSNAKIFSMLCEAFHSEGFKFSATVKKDRSGLYTLYSVPFKLADAEKVNQFFVKLNAKSK